MMESVKKTVLYGADVVNQNVKSVLGSETVKKNKAAFVDFLSSLPKKKNEFKTEFPSARPGPARPISSGETSSFYTTNNVSVKQLFDSRKSPYVGSVIDESAPNASGSGWNRVENATKAAANGAGGALNAAANNKAGWFDWGPKKNKTEIAIVAKMNERVFKPPPPNPSHQPTSTTSSKPGQTQADQNSTFNTGEATGTLYETDVVDRT
ncbi:hypothetical protein SASPL_103688 [Salvia splendens]|uniref:Uncharacterized protein n=1 Tax=Salvia splendens TaxID=180675 RepID=A0A8X8YII5_SALSN|nr:hypothetical protein SASPL_103688 [Salvia splendens]